jgi:chromosome segregation ATPase
MARDLTEAMAPVRADIARLDGRMQAADGRLQALDNRLDTMDGRLNVMDGRLTAMDGQLHAINASLNALKAISAQTQRIAALVSPPFCLFSCLLRKADYNLDLEPKCRRWRGIAI